MPTLPLIFIWVKSASFSTSLSLVKLGPRTPENRWAEMLNPLNCTAKTCQIIDYSAVDYSILLKFCIDFIYIAREVLLKFKVKRSKVKVTFEYEYNYLVRKVIKLQG